MISVLLNNLKRLIFISHTLPLKRICSETNDLDSNVKNLKEWIRKRSCPEQLIKGQVACALQTASNNSANYSNKQKRMVSH